MAAAKIRFLGAAQSVTGSKYLLSLEGRNILIDCGLFQGLKENRLKNWAPFPVDPKTIDTIVLTHAHIDHSGYIPRLIKEGFRGKILCTAGTLALCRALLPDTGYLQEEEAEFLNRKHISKHNPALPLFSKEDAERSLKYFVPKPFNEDIHLGDNIRIRFYYAGHILGAASVVITAGTLKIAFSGDVGRPTDPLLRMPEVLPPVDYLVVESTYGDRVHPVTDPMDDLADAVNTAAARRGVILIPSFAVGRAQTLLHLLANLKKAGRIPDIPMYLNSPLAASVTETFCQFKSLHRLSEAQCNEFRDMVHFVRSAEESKLLNEQDETMLIISASGMATGGRILHHLKKFAPDEKNMILLCGFQAAGTRGQALQDGAEEIKIHGMYVPVRAEVRVIENLSAHADFNEIAAWLGQAHMKPRKIFVTHGEGSAPQAMADHLHKVFGWDCVVPRPAEEYQLEGECPLIQAHAR